MGIIGAIGVVRAVERLKSGRSQTEKMSIADITMITVNGSEAQKNLPLDQYLEVKALFDELMKKTEKKLYDLDDYLTVTTAITMFFDSVAPFELYCGSPEIAASIRSMKQDPSFYDMRSMFLNSPELIGFTRADKYDVEDSGDSVYSYTDDESDEEDIIDDEYDDESVEEDLDEYDDEVAEEFKEIIGNYGYKESYIFFCDSEEYSEEFDAQLDIDIFINECYWCNIFVDGEMHSGYWKHEHDDYYALSDFNNDNVVVLRGLSQYRINISDGILTVFEDDPQIAGIRFQHVFEKE